MPKHRSQWAGAIAAAGGFVWVAWTLALTLTDVGTDSVPIVGAIVLSTVGVLVGHYAVEEFYGSRMERPGTGGVLVGLLGGLVFVAGQLLRLLRGGGEAVIGLGVLTLIVGSILVAAGIVRTRIQPPWLGVLLALGTIAFFGFEFEAAAATLYGFAWVALGQDFYRYDPPDGRFGDARADYGWLS